MRPLIQAIGLILAGLAALGLTAWLIFGASGSRPASSGDVGEVVVFAQFPDGPRPLPVGRPSALRRPQSLAFRVSAEGQGPRRLRVDVESPTGLRTLHEETLRAPLDRHHLNFVARFGERDPDRWTLVVVIEAPHDRPRVRRYPIQLVTRAHRFWDGER
ncbi:MAG: hypothetical protein AAFZ18_17395 [Myxococcota bacterium]